MIGPRSEPVRVARTPGQSVRLLHRVTALRLALAFFLVVAGGAVPANGQGECTPGWLPVFGEAAAGTDGPVNELVRFDDGQGAGTRTYAIGSFTKAGGTPAAGVAVWTGESWEPIPGTPFSSCVAATVFDDGSGAALYCAGALAGVPQPASGVQRWNGVQWTAVGGVFDASIVALAGVDTGSGTRLYACGAPSSIAGLPERCVFQWDGSSWAGVGDALSGSSGLSVKAIAAYDDGDGSGLRLYIGGQFSSNSQGEALDGVAQLVGGTWKPVGGGGVDSISGVAEVHTLLPIPDDASGVPSLYVGGQFDTVAGQPIPTVARLAGNTWNSCGFEAGGQVFRLGRLPAPVGATPSLVAVGGFNSPSGSALATYDGSQWTVNIGLLSPSANGKRLLCWCLVPTQNDGVLVCVGGAMSGIAGVTASNLALWDGAQWQPFGSGLNAAVRATVIFDDGSGAGPALYIGGEANAGRGSRFGYVAKWTGTTWQPLGAGMNGPVYALTVHDDGNGPRLIAGGAFTQASAAPALRVARWNGSAWTAVGGGVGTTGAVTCLTSFDDGAERPNKTLYAGGTFNIPPGLARFEDGAWRQVGSMTGSVECMAVWDNGTGEALYVGGSSVVDGPVLLGTMGRFDGVSWSADPPSPLGTVNALAVLQQPGESSSLLVAAGAFVSAGSTNAQRIATWDGLAWRKLAQGLNQPCYALSTILDPVAGKQLVVAGGSFTASGAVALQNIGAWDGVQWRALDEGVWGQFATSSTTGVRTLLNAPLTAVEGNTGGDGNDAADPSAAMLVVGGAFTRSPSGDGGLAVWSPCPPPPNPDLNGDGIVNGADLGLLLVAWGPCPGCAADLNRDGAVTGADLGILLAAWTP